MMKKKMKNKGVSAVIGVILMVAITVAIAATVVVYVQTFYEDKNIGPNGLNFYSEGTVENTTFVGTFVYDVKCPSCPDLTFEVWNINFTGGEKNTFYFEIYSLENVSHSNNYVNGIMPPLVGKHVRINYEFIEDRQYMGVRGIEEL